MLPSHLISRLRSIDWDFSGNYSESAFSGIHFHPGRFASQLPAALIGLFSKPGDLVLDPFVGSGTTPVEAQRLGRRSIGIDLNPIACLAAHASTLTASAARINAVLTEIKKEATSHLGKQIPTDLGPAIKPIVPATVQVDKWYSKAASEQLGLLWGLLQAYKGRKRLLAHVAFSAILLPVCREVRHWGYVCDNSTPKSNHEGDVLEEFCRVLDQLSHAYLDRDKELVARLGGLRKVEKAKIICEDAKAALEDVPRESVNLVLTSPPYFGVSDYVKAQRLSMEWFGAAIEPLRLREIGARSKRHRALAAKHYVAELAETFRGVRRCLCDGGYCIVIMGESSKRERVLPQIRKSLQDCGFTLEFDLKRRVSPQRRQAPSINTEHLLILSR